MSTRRNYFELDNFATSRSARLRDVRSLSADFLRADSEATWDTADKLVDRMWTVDHPALALERVPSHVPHTHGEILSAALVHIVTPRVFFPAKPELPSDSEKVRRYAGVWVAGAEHSTSIAFGYAAESYIDYGVPLMFLPVFCFGVAMGVLYTLFRQLVFHHELFVAFGTVAFWLSLYLFERSWARISALTIALMVYLGGPSHLIDNGFLMRRAQSGDRTLADHVIDTTELSESLRVVHVSRLFRPCIRLWRAAAHVMGLCKRPRSTGVDVGSSRRPPMVPANRTARRRRTAGRTMALTCVTSDRARPRSVLCAALDGVVAAQLRNAYILHIHGLWHLHGLEAAAAARQARRPYVISPRGMLEPTRRLASRRVAKALVVSACGSPNLIRVPRACMRRRPGGEDA